VVLVQDGPQARSPAAVASAPASAGEAVPGALAASAVVPGAVAAVASGAEPAAAGAAATGPGAAVLAQAEEAASAVPVPSSPGAIAAQGDPVCLEAAYYAESELPEVERALGKLANKGRDWSVRTVPAPGTWLVYMGPYASPQEAERKHAELRRMGLAFEEVRSPAHLVPGVSLGRFNEAARANERLAEVQRKGVRTAQVQVATPARTLYAVRMNKADGRLQTVAVAVRPALRGKRFVPCP
jgi:SPOR domain